MATMEKSAGDEENLPVFDHPGAKFREFAARGPDHGLGRFVPLGYIAGMSPVRIAGLILVGFAVLFAFGNLYFAVMDTPGGGVTMYDLWAKVSLGSLEFCRYIVERYLWPPLWQGISVLLAQSAWLVFGVVGLILVGLGKGSIE